MKKRLFKNKLFLPVIIVFALLILATSISVPLSFNDHNYIITVTDKERIYEESGDSSSSKYLVFGDNSQGDSLVFENTDTLIRGKFNSSNTQGKLKVGKTYKITVIGFRLAFLSSYENIIKVEEVK